ncbi:IS1/IS1595 family N-terminal zinc-binding domain-containing protein [Moraxella marmotae]
MCPFCQSQKTVKNGKKHHKQQYLCKSCQHQFLAAMRLDNPLLWA